LPAKKRRHDHLGDVRAGRPVTQLVLKLSGRLFTSTVPTRIDATTAEMLLKVATFFEIARKHLLSPATRQVHSDRLTFSNQSFSACSTQFVKQFSSEENKFLARLFAVQRRGQTVCSLC
jgi:hypothetical protein